MSGTLTIRRAERGGFGIYRDELLLIFGLSNADVTDFARETNKSVNSFNAKSKLKDNEDTVTNTQMTDSVGPIRKPLILKPYLDDIKTMLKKDPSITIKDIERHLRGRGAKFSSTTAITNLARVHGLRLAA